GLSISQGLVLWGGPASERECMDRRRRLSKHYFGIPDTFVSKLTHCGKRNCEVTIEESGCLVGRWAVQKLRKIEKRAENDQSEFFALIARARAMRRLDPRPSFALFRSARQSYGDVSLEHRDGFGVAEVQPGGELVGVRLGEGAERRVVLALDELDDF